MLVMYDLEDKTYYPVYFDSEKESNRFKENIISESHFKLIKSYDL